MACWSCSARSRRTPHLLEVGIGTGRIAVPLAERGVRVTGIDISAKMLAILRDKRPDIDVMFAEASRPPLRDASFDGSLFVHILHLVPDPEATIRATMAAVRPGGVMIEAGDDKDASVVSQAARGDRRDRGGALRTSNCRAGSRTSRPRRCFTRC